MCCVCNEANDMFRGPEVELWLGAEEGTDPATENDWGLLPFMALSDGAHAYVCPAACPFFCKHNPKAFLRAKTSYTVQ